MKIVQNQTYEVLEEQRQLLLSLYHTIQFSVYSTNLIINAL